MPADQAPVLLGPDAVGRRVVVRHVLPGQTGPSGGPALSDVLGECLSWGGADGVVVVRREDGALAEVPVRDVVAGKVVPPRPVRLDRLAAHDADRVVVAGWRAVDTEPLGEWLLRRSGGFSRRGSSALALGDPGVPLEEAVAAVTGWYAARGDRPLAHVVPGSIEAEAFAAAGWSSHEPTWLLVGRTEAVLRETSGPRHDVRLDERLDDAWLATDDRARQHGADARAVLEAGVVRFATVRSGDEVLARGRVALHDGLAGIASLWTREDLRGEGLGRSVLTALLGWARAEEARTTYLQVTEANPRARGLYEGLGYRPHHRYDYVVEMEG